MSSLESHQSKGSFVVFRDPYRAKVSWEPGEARFDIWSATIDGTTRFPKLIKPRPIVEEELKQDLLNIGMSQQDATYVAGNIREGLGEIK